MAKYLIVTILFPLLLYAQADKIIGVVDKEAVTQSEIEQKLRLLGVPLTKDSQEKMLENVIQTKLLLIAAQRETLTVSEEEIEDALSNTINSIKENFQSEEAFAAELQKLGVTEYELRDYYREDVKSNLIVRTLIQQKFGNLATSDIEALHYYETHPESIPDIPTTARYTGIFLPIMPGEETLREKEELIETVQNRLLAGEDFGTLASIYSDDPAAKVNRGNLGTVNLADLDPIFRQEIEDMTVGETRLVQGFGMVHLLRCDMKMGNRATLRTIVLKLIPSRDDTLAALSLASEIRDSVEMEIIPKIEGSIIISDGSEYLPKPPLIDEIETEGETKIIEHEDGIYIVKVHDIQPTRFPTFEEVKDDLKALLSQKKTLDKLNYLISNLEEEIYVERRI